MLLRIVLLLFIVAVFSYAGARYYEPRILFHPDKGMEITPRLYGIPYEEITFSSGPYRLTGWYCDNEANRYFLYYHGNGGNMADRIDIVKIARFLKVNLLMIDYRGYGRSEGYPTAAGFIEDSHAAARWLFAHTDATPARTFFWGHSLGSAAAIAAATRYPDLAGILVESGFVSLRTLAYRLYPFVPTFFVSDIFLNGPLLSNLTQPKLLIHGREDRVIAYEEGQRLYYTAREPKEFFPIPGAGHNNTYIVAGNRFLNRLQKWMNDIGLEETNQKEEPSP